MKYKVARFDECEENMLDNIKEFAKDKKIIDVKQRVILSHIGEYYSEYVIFYEEESE